jgi:hypothetical protein
VRWVGKVTRLLPRKALLPLTDQRNVAALATRRGEVQKNGAYGIRTRDLLNAIEALYQLS